MSKAKDEYELAIQEYFEYGELDPDRIEEFIDWYNNKRLQTDTGLTPSQMYELLYSDKSLSDVKDELLLKMLKCFDTNYTLEPEEIESKMKSIIEEIATRGGSVLPDIYPLLQSPYEWSCYFALVCIRKIKAKESVPYLIEFILKNDSLDLDGCFEEIEDALVDIGQDALDSLIYINTVAFEEKKYIDYLIGAIERIVCDKSYQFMKETLQRYLNDAEFREFFDLEMFIGGFIAQNNKDIIPLLKQLYNLPLTEYEKIEVDDTIDFLTDPEGAEKRFEEIFSDFESLK